MAKQVQPAAARSTRQSQSSSKESQSASTHGLKAANKRTGVEKPLDVQIGGDHYKSFVIQPVEFIHANEIPFIEGNCIKYLCRWKQKGGVKDLEKVKHYVDVLIELENSKWKSIQSLLGEHKGGLLIV